MKDPARSLKAVLLPMVIAPKAVVNNPVRTVAGMGQLKPSLTCEKKGANGVALSRERAHHVRPTVRKVPIRHGVSERKTMKRRPKVALVLPVACIYTSANGKEPLLVITALRSDIPYNRAVAKQKAARFAKVSVQWAQH